MLIRMTNQSQGGDEDRERVLGLSAWDAAVAEGLDMSLVEVSLRKSPWERMRDHDAALALAEVLRNVKDGQ